MAWLIWCWFFFTQLKIAPLPSERCYEIYLIFFVGTETRGTVLPTFICDLNTSCKLHNGLSVFIWVLIPFAVVWARGFQVSCCSYWNQWTRNWNKVTECDLIKNQSNYLPNKKNKLITGNRPFDLYGGLLSFQKDIVKFPGGKYVINFGFWIFKHFDFDFFRFTL